MITGIWPLLEARDVGATVDLYCTWLAFERVKSAEIVARHDRAHGLGDEADARERRAAKLAQSVSGG